MVRFILGLMLALSISGCAAATPEQPILTPTTEPSPTTAPTNTAIPVTIETLTDTWTRTDPERGTLFLIFDADGNFTASHGTPEGIMHTGHFSLEGNVFTFLDGWDCSPLGETPGTYTLRLAGEGKFLIFTTLGDACPGRPEGLNGYRFDRTP